MTERTTQYALSTTGGAGISRRSLARATGGLYLAFVLLLTLADVVSHLGPGDTDQVVDSLENDPTRFAIGLTLGMLSAFVFVVAAWGLFVLLGPVNRDLALLFLLLNAIGAVIQVASYLPVLVAMLAEDATGVSQVSVVGPVMECRLDGPADAFVKSVAAHTVLGITSVEPDLEEVFLGLYAGSDRVQEVNA